MRITRFHRILGAGSAVFLAGALAGCLSLTAQLSIDENGLVSGTQRVEISKQAMSMMGVTSLESFEEQITSDPEFTSGQDGCSEPTFAETDLAFTVSCSYDKQAMTNTDDYPVKVTRSGELITMVFAQEATDLGDETGADEPTSPTEEPDLGTISLTVEFPGPIDRISGANADSATKVDDDTIKITATATEAVDVTVTSGITTATTDVDPVVLVVGGIVLLGAIGLVTVLVMRSRKGHQEVGPTPEPVSASGTGTGGDDATPTI